MTTDFDHKSFLANVGESAGVYQMLDEEEVLYVGKAKNLKNRLSSYFRTTRLPTKTLAMMARVNDITVTVTHTEDEALLLESNLIKKLKPRYNVLLRDSKSTHLSSWKRITSIRASVSTGEIARKRVNILAPMPVGMLYAKPWPWCKRCSPSGSATIASSEIAQDPVCNTRSNAVAVPASG
jgi:hypothetical protein